jgi:hypothetical protein
VPPLPKDNYTWPTYNYTKPAVVFKPNITYEVPTYNYTYNVTAMDQVYMSKLEEFKAQYAAWNSTYG